MGAGENVASASSAVEAVAVVVAVAGVSESVDRPDAAIGNDAA